MTQRKILASLELRGGKALSMTVTDIMNSLPITGSPEDSIGQVRQVMTKHYISNWPEHAETVGA